MAAPTTSPPPGRLSALITPSPMQAWQPTPAPSPTPLPSPLPALSAHGSIAAVDGFHPKVGVLAARSGLPGHQLAASSYIPSAQVDDGKITREEFLKSFVAAKLDKSMQCINTPGAPKAGVLPPGSWSAAVPSLVAAPSPYIPSMQVRCQSCGSQWQPGNSFCHNCGMRGPTSEACDEPARGRLRTFELPTRTRTLQARTAAQPRASLQALTAKGLAWNAQVPTMVPQQTGEFRPAAPIPIMVSPPMKCRVTPASLSSTARAFVPSPSPPTARQPRPLASATILSARAQPCVQAMPPPVVQGRPAQTYL